MVKLAASLLAVAATTFSFNLPANDMRGVVLAEFPSSASPVSSQSRDIASQLSLKSESAESAPANAWLYALGFLGLVVLRRTRSGPMF